MNGIVPATTRVQYAEQLAAEMKTLVVSIDRLTEIVVEMRTDELFRLLGFETWESFCVDYVGVTKRTANRWIDAWKQKAIAAKSEPKAISQTAGQSVAAGHSVPVVESPALKSGDTTDASPTPPAVEPPAADGPPGPPDTGATGDAEPGSTADGEPETTSDGRGDELADAVTDEPPKNDTGPVPTLDEEANALYLTIMNATEGVGSKWTPEQTADILTKIQAELNNARKTNGGQVKKPVAVVDVPKRSVNTTTTNGTSTVTLTNSGTRAGLPIARDLSRREATPMFKAGKK